MMSILHNFMLKNLTCSVCEKYLSVSPVKVYPDRTIKCGRCSQENDDGVESLYGNVIKNCMFKCVNRYEGCNKLLLLSEVAEHEYECASGNYNCPKCEYKFSGSSYHLLLHYTKQHPRSILKNENFSLRIQRDFRERYLYLVKDRIFFVLVEHLSRQSILYLSAVSLIPQKNVTQWFSVKQFHKKYNTTNTEKKPCHSIERFQCDYFSIQVTSTNEINCRLHLDLSQDSRVVDQISVNKKRENNSSISVYTQTDLETRGIYRRCPPPRRRFRGGLVSSSCLSKSAVSIDHEHQEHNALSSSSASNSSISGDREHQEPIPSRSACVQTLSGILGVKLTDDFKKKYPGYELTACGTALFKDDDRIELTCSNCKQLTGCNVFNCHLSRHIVCWDCKAWCGMCNTSTNGWNVNLSEVNELLLLPCKWQCGEHFLGTYLTQHELRCENFKSNCPVCHQTGMNLEQLSVHLVGYHNNYENMTRFNIRGYLEKCRMLVRREVYFFHNGLWFKMSWAKKDGSYEVSIESLGDTGLYEMAIVCDSGQMYNKIVDNSVVFALSANPKFYLKRIRNL